MMTRAIAGIITGALAASSAFADSGGNDEESPFATPPPGESNVIELNLPGFSNDPPGQDVNARIRFLDNTAFSHRTRLRGPVEVVDTFQSDPSFPIDITPDNDVFVSRARLNFDTSFTGQDRLRVRLNSQNAPSPEATVNANAALGLDDLYYDFPQIGPEQLNSETEVRIGVAVNDATGFALQLNASFVDENAGPGFKADYSFVGGPNEIDLNFDPNGNPSLFGVAYRNDIAELELRANEGRGGAFPDLLSERDLAGTALQFWPYFNFPHTDGAGPGPDAGEPIEFYQMPVSNAIQIVPTLIDITDSASTRREDDVVLGTLRTTFRF